MKTSLPLIFFGTEDFSAISLLALIQAGFDVRAVVTKPDFRRGRGKTLQQPRVKQIAESAGIPVLQPAKVVEITELAKALNPVAGVLVSYGKIIPQSVIELFTPGIINVHPSLLPKYRGPSPIESAIANGDTETGVSIMQLSAAMDAGPVYAQKKVPLNGLETRLTAYDYLGRVGAEMLAETLPLILSGELLPTAQDSSQASYCSLLRKDDGVLDPEHTTAEQAERLIRAYLGYPKTRLQLGEHEAIVTKARVATDEIKKGLLVPFADNTSLEIQELIGPSGKSMTGEAFMRGYGLN